MSDETLIRHAGIRSAVIIDDGYDEIPEVSELLEHEAWDSFFDDAQGAQGQRISELFPAYNPGDREELKRDQAFINAIWFAKEDLRDLLSGLFDDYEEKIRVNHPFLETVEENLRSLGIPFERCGREFIEIALEADLIVIDLYLGIKQGAEDRQITIDRLKALLERRAHRPLPSIVLMSQATTINQDAKDFRHEVKLHASSFRYIQKADLSKRGRLGALIVALASHRADSHSLARFLHTWEDQAIAAVHKSVSALRKIDIDDLQHIRSMLLRFEGINTSSYMLDIFDRVLQYEIESNDVVIEAAKALDQIADDPAPLMISNDRDTYELLKKTIFVNPQRRQHSTGAEWPIMFGDIIGPEPERDVKRRGFFAGRRDLVFFVASPECDLVRKDGLVTALLLAGTLRTIDTSKPGLAVTGGTTPILDAKGTGRFQVDWDFGDLRTVNLQQMKRLLNETTGDAVIAARLREGAALNLRQQLLSNMGRVGELAPLPRSKKFQASLYFPLEGGGVEEIDLPEGIVVSGNILISRNGRYAAAILDSNCEQELTEVLLRLDLATVARKSRPMFEKLREQNRLRQIFRSGFQGIELPLSGHRGTGLLKLEEEQPETDDKRPKIDKLATVVNTKDVVAQLDKDLRGSGLILQVEIEEAG